MQARFSRFYFLKKMSETRSREVPVASAADPDSIPVYLNSNLVFSKIGFGFFGLVLREGCRSSVLIWFLAVHCNLKFCRCITAFCGYLLFLLCVV